MWLNPKLVVLIIAPIVSAIAIFGIVVQLNASPSYSLEQLVDKTKNLDEVRNFSDRYTTSVTVDRDFELVHSGQDCDKTKTCRGIFNIDTIAELRIIMDNGLNIKDVILTCYPHSDGYQYTVEQNITEYLKEEGCYKSV